MSEMVERVARAISEIPVSNPSYIATAQETLRHTLSPSLIDKIACAAIAAMREPTEAMISAWLGEGQDSERGDWQAMIDAALKE